MKAYTLKSELCEGLSSTGWGCGRLACQLLVSLLVNMQACRGSQERSVQVQYHGKQA